MRNLSIACYTYASLWLLVIMFYLPSRCVTSQMDNLRGTCYLKCGPNITQICIWLQQTSPIFAPIFPLGEIFFATTCEGQATCTSGSSIGLIGLQPPCSLSREKSAYTTDVYFGTVFRPNTPNFGGSLRSPVSFRSLSCLLSLARYGKSWRGTE